MHYKNGREAHNGDIVLLLMISQQPVVGVLIGAKAEFGSDCNGQIITPMSCDYPQCADLKNCLHIDDIAAATIPDSSQPAQAPAPAPTPDPTPAADGNGQ